MPSIDLSQQVFGRNVPWSGRISLSASWALREQLRKAGESFAMSPDAVARAVAYVIEQPDDVNVGEITLRSRAQP
jgi:NADP-dependent 3-hydroxy acid dehydrogenase YdfG